MPVRTRKELLAGVPAAAVPPVAAGTSVSVTKADDAEARRIKMGLQYVYHLPVTGNGAFQDNGVAYQVKLVKGVVQIPSELQGADKAAYTELLKKNGFKEVWVADGEPTSKPVEQVKPKSWKLAHPDLDGTGEGFTGNISLGKEDGFKKPVDIHVENGVVILKAEHEKVKDALIKKGYRELTGLVI